MQLAANAVEKNIACPILSTAVVHNHHIYIPPPIYISFSNLLVVIRVYETGVQEVRHTWVR